MTAARDRDGRTVVRGATAIRNAEYKRLLILDEASSQSAIVMIAPEVARRKCLCVQRVMADSAAVGGHNEFCGSDLRGA